MHNYNSDIVYIGRKSKVFKKISKSLPKWKIFSLSEALKSIEIFQNKKIVFFSLPYFGEEKEYFNFIRDVDSKVFINISSICAINVPNSSAIKTKNRYQLSKCKSHKIINNKLGGLNIVCGSIENNDYGVNDYSLGCHAVTLYDDLIRTIQYFLINYEKVGEVKNSFCLKIFGVENRFSNLLRIIRIITDLVNWRITFLFDVTLKLIGIKNRFYTHESNSLCIEEILIGINKCNMKHKNNYLTINHQKKYNNKLGLFIKNFKREKEFGITLIKYNSLNKIFIIEGFDNQNNKYTFFSNKISINKNDYINSSYIKRILIQENTFLDSKSKNYIKYVKDLYTHKLIKILN